MTSLKTLIGAACFSALALAGAAHAQDMVLPQTTTVELNPEDPKEEKLGKLSYRGGVEIEPGKGKNKIGGLSGLEWADGRLHAVSDDGRWFGMELDESRDELRDVVEIETGSLRGANGKRLSGKTRADAESLAVDEAGEWLVGFEREHRVLRYSALGEAAQTATLDVSSLTTDAEDNGGLETLAITPDGWLACGEWASTARPNCLRQSDQALTSLSLETPSPLNELGGVPTGADCASNGVCYILFRSYSRELGNAAAILAMSADGQSEVLASWTNELTIDNFEGLAVREEGTQTYLYIVSDNNFSKCREPQNPECQRTLLLKFLVNQNAAQAPGTPEPVYQTARVIMDTPRGSITIDLETERAPITAANFLRYVEEGRYDGTRFYRAVRSNWTDEQAGFLQGGTQNDPKRVLDPIAHEPTNETGLSHTNGALSMARFAPGTAKGDFSIMIGDQRGLDANPTAEDPELHPGFAVFGYVVAGMDVVRSIHLDPVDPDEGEGFLKGQMLTDTVEIISIRRAPIARDTEEQALTAEEQAALEPA